jgi:SAM-dependent methyltransferase
MLIVDVGCGWLKYPATVENPKLKTQDNVIGVDVCRYNNDVIASALRTPFQNEVADVVTVLQFIEHVDAVSLVCEAWRILKPNGSLLIETPNALYIFRVLRALKGIEANPYPEHIQTFSAPELRNLLRRNGFKNIEISYYNIQVDNPNWVLRHIKQMMAYFVNKLFPMLDRGIRVVAIKDSEAKFAEYC